MKDLRLRRLIPPPSRPLLIVPLDHGVTLGPIPGLEDIRQTVGDLCQTDINALVLHKGSVHACRDVLSRHPNVSVLLHLSASISISPNAQQKVLVASVEEAVRLGVDGVSVHVNLGAHRDAEMLVDLGCVANECDRWGMPLLVMAYPRGDGLDEHGLEENLIAARVAMELGADLVKINYPGGQAQLEKIVNSVSIPVVVAGGAMREDEDLFENVENILRAGARGVAIGRNVFQRANRKETIVRFLQSNAA